MTDPARQWNFTKALRFTAAFLLLLSRAASSGAVELQEQTVRYSVLYGNVDAGKLEIIIERENSQLKTTVISHLSAVAKLFLPGLTAVTWFDIKDKTAILDRGEAVEHGSNKVAGRFFVNYAEGKLEHDPGDSSAISPLETFDSTTFPIGLITGNIDQIGGVVVREVNARKSSRYRYQTPVEETLELNGRRYETWKVTRNKLGSVNRTVTFWLDRNNQNIPLKIVTTKKKKSTTMTLIN